MSIFSSILQKIGIGKPAANLTTDAAAKAKAEAAVDDAMAKAAAEAKARVAAQAQAAKPAVAAPVVAPPMAAHPAAAPISPAPVAPAPVTPAPLRPAAVSVVDVVSNLEGLAKSHPGLDWKVSIVDLLKLLDIDSSFEARKELATELGCPADLMSDSARMNVWLHKTVLQKIAENGGNIPASLLV
jgi:hypothetical protein